MLRWALVVALSLAASHARASALPPFGVERILPASGALPTNARLYVSGYAFHDAIGALDLMLEMHVDGAPVAAALGPPRCIGMYSDVCVAVIEHDPLPAGASVTVTSAPTWAGTIDAAYTVGDGVDATPPVYVGEATASASFIPAHTAGTDCNRSVDAHYDVAITLSRAADDQGVTVYAVRARDAAWATDILLVPPEEPSASFATRFTLRVDAGTHCFDVAAIDVGGNRTALPAPLCIVLDERVVGSFFSCGDDAPDEPAIVDGGVADDAGEVDDDAGAPVDDDSGNGGGCASTRGAGPLALAALVRARRRRSP